MATVIGLVHALDDAVLNRQPGVPITQHLLGLTFVSMFAVGAIVVFWRLRTGLQAALALIVGSAALANGGLHILHVARFGVGELSGSDATGLLAAGAGALLVLMAAALPFARRGERRASRLRRWTARLLSTGGVVVLVFYLVVPIGVGIGQTHRFREPIDQPPPSFEAVTFLSSDGLLLHGWYAPSSNGAAVVVVSSARGDRLGSTQHAELLARHGYGVLTYDARGSGESEGSPNGYGWGWTRDVAGAMEFLRRQPEIDLNRIGGLGLSTGADVLIEVAATDQRLAAVVADGATAHTFADIPPANRWLNSYMLPVMVSTALFSGSLPGPPMQQLAAKVGPTPLLLIAAGSLPLELEMNRVYAAAGGESVRLWELPEVGHTAAIRDDASAYERRVIGHFDGALLAQPRPNPR